MTPCRRKEIAEAARKFLRENNVNKPPVPIKRMTERLGARIVSSTLDDELSGMIYEKNDIPIIGVNFQHHPNRQRFTIAHECGHFILHRDMIKREIHVDKKSRMLRSPLSAEGVSEVEIEANLFAAATLMPEDFLRKALKNEPADIDDEETVKSLARKFRVSPAAMSFRLGNLFT